MADKRARVRFYCHNCLTSFSMPMYNMDSLFYRKCIECGCDKQDKIQYKGVDRLQNWHVYYAWEVEAYSHEEAREIARKRGFKDYDCMGSSKKRIV